MTVRVPGVKAKLTMSTVLPELDVEAVVFDVEQLVEPIDSAVIRKEMSINTIFFFIFVSSFYISILLLLINYFMLKLNLGVIPMTEKTIIIINLALQGFLLLTVLVAGYLARFRRKLKVHCLILRIAVPAQIVSIFAIMLPAMLGYVHRGDRTQLFNILMLIHHSLGLAVIALWIYINLRFQGVIKHVGKLAIPMRFAFFLWITVLILGIYLYLVTWIL